LKSGQMRLSFLMVLVAALALGLAGIPYLGWAIMGFPYQRRYVQVEVDGVTHQVDTRIWPAHDLNPVNRK
jgi:hypothetical protein